MPQSAQLALVPSDNEKFTVRRKPNAEYRSREHLTESEVERLIDALKNNRWGHRDATMVLLAYRHGLRAAELVDLRCGSRSISTTQSCTSVGSRMGRRRRIR
jgi:type 1 fimbriae regulatory protein FimB/type 1 fimbriae regulatory protein FimE